VDIFLKKALIFRVTKAVTLSSSLGRSRTMRTMRFMDYLLAQTTAGVITNQASRNRKGGKRKDGS
jgi:hypothetical protein